MFSSFQFPKQWIRLLLISQVLRVCPEYTRFQELYKNGRPNPGLVCTYTVVI